jgi:hypothetical protein
MKHKRETDTSYFHKYHSLRMNYSIFIMEMKETISMEANGQPGAALAAPPLLSSQSLDPFRVFTVPKPPPRKIPKGHIVSFRLRRFHRGKDCSNWTHEGGRWAPPCGPATWPRGGSSFLPRGVSRWLLLTVICFLKKNDVAKRLSSCNVWKVPETNIYAKTGKPALHS